MTQAVSIGIQWGHGSFNEIALLSFLDSSPPLLEDKKVEICYLYTTEAVLKALEKWEIHYGQFALANSIGGLVDETLRSIGPHTFSYVTHYEIPIEHVLMIHPQTKLSEITTVMGHDQAIRQCENTIKQYFPTLALKAWTDELTDNASIAEALGNGTLPKSTASLGHKSLASLYNLSIVRDHMADRNDNRTTFVLVGR